jgi:methanol metabolism-related c-type cytochrome
MLSLRFAVLAACLACGALPLAAQQATNGVVDEAYERPYTICAENTVDAGTYNGYRRYHAFCHQCHGPDGLGSSYAPSLVESLKILHRDQFNEVVVNGRQNLAAGQEKVMPSFGHVEDVMLYLDDIYSYLKARSDSKIGRGRPQRCPS